MFEVRRSAIQGKGAFALRRIKKGTRIIEYTGERISEDEAIARYDDTTMKRHHTFLFALNGKMSIDGAAGGNESRFINHSCDPNCEALMEDDERVFIYAKRDIELGDELSYDYAYVGVDPNDPEVRAMYACRCGAAKCRGSIVAPPKRKKKSTRARSRTRSQSQSRTRSTELAG